MGKLLGWAVSTSAGAKVCKCKCGVEFLGKGLVELAGLRRDIIPYRKRLCGASVVAESRQRFVHIGLTCLVGFDSIPVG